MDYCIIDIETTGGSPKSEKITEIAIYRFNGKEVVSEFVTLVNPERKIPYYITQITGISNAMVAESPKFFEIARQIVDITQGCVFVAHNVAFDYKFIQEEFKQLGYSFEMDKLCTVKLSRTIIPGYKSYSLGNICNELGIQIESRHRAAGDAKATVELFKILLSLRPELILGTPSLATKSLADTHIDPLVIQNLPEKPGVYYFYDHKQELIYIGKSKTIRTRVISHFRNFSSRKAIEMKESVAHISYELTGSELIAELRESDEIKKYKPKYNRAQRRALSNYGLIAYQNQAGYLCFQVVTTKGKPGIIPLKSFSSIKAAREYCRQMVEKYELCMKHMGLYNSDGACFNYEIKSCRGACLGKESPESYNMRANQIVLANQFKHNNYFILNEGRDENELSVVKVEDNRYIGYGFVAKELSEGNIHELHECIHMYDDNKDIQQIIRRHLRSGQCKDIIPYKTDMKESFNTVLSTTYRL